MQNKDCFFEGATERAVLERLKLITPFKKEIDEGGKDQINDRIKKVLGPKLGGEAVRCLIMRDLDSHVEETAQRIKQAVTDCFKSLFTERGFDEKTVALNPHTQFSNVYLFQATNLDIKVALHIAEYKHSANFKNSTIDDYILNLALRTETIQQVIKNKQESRRKEFLDCLPAVEDEDEATKLSQIAQAIIKKVTEEIPLLLQGNNFPALKEAKQYLHFYSAVTQEHVSPAVLSKAIVKCSSEKDKEEVLASLFAAIEFIST